MRVVRGVGLTAIGVVAGFMAAAAFAKRAVRSRGDEESDDVALVAIFDRLPPGCRVESTVTALGGGVDVKKPSSEDEAGPRVTLDGLAVFGGIAVGARKA